MTVIDTLEMNKWNEAALLDRIVVWDRWIEKGIAPEGTKEARDAAMQIIIQRVERLRSGFLMAMQYDNKCRQTGQPCDAPKLCACFLETEGWCDAPKETGHEADE
jgi:hypothetical protein